MRNHYLITLAGLIICLMGNHQAALAEDVEIHGFISQGYLKTNQNNFLAETDDGSFQFNEMGINFTAYPTSSLKIGCQFFAMDLGDVGNDNIVVNWAFAEYHYQNWLGFRAGLLKTHFGLYNDTRDYDSLRTAIFLPTSNYIELLRDTLNTTKGIGIFGNVPLGPAGSLKYQIGTSGTQTSPETGSAKFLKSANGFSEISDIVVGERLYGIHFQWMTPVDGLSFGMTYDSFDYGFDAIKPTRIGDVMIDVPITFKAHKADYLVFFGEYIWNNWVFAAETYRHTEDSDVYHGTSGAFLQKADVDTRKSFYVKLSYRFTDWLETGYYYSKFQLQPDTDNDQEKLKEHCLSFRFDINPYWLFKLEAHLMNGKFGVYPDNDGHIYNEWMLYAAKMSFSF